jgi:hypothetical protein
MTPVIGTPFRWSTEEEQNVQTDGKPTADSKHRVAFGFAIKLNGYVRVEEIS